MKERTYIYFVFIQTVILIFSINAEATDLWQTPFDTTATDSKSFDSELFLDDVLKLVAVQNSSFRSFDFQLRAAQSDLKQAGLWSNPELDVEFEEVGWDAPGFSESELTISLAQEFEFLGQRGARKKVAFAQLDAADLQVKLSAFDLYLDTKQRFYALAHAQQVVDLSQKSVKLANEIVENINYRLEKGAALQSELLLAQLEEQRAQLALDQSKQDVIAFEAALVSLWKARPSGVRVSLGTEPDFDNLFDKISLLSYRIDSTRQIIQMRSELDILEAEKVAAITEARPTITLSGGFKRFEADKSKSYLVGISMPIPLFNRNQGTRQSLVSQQRSLEYDIEQGKTETISNIQSQTIRLKKSIDRHTTLDSLLLPTAEKAYEMLQKAYEAGRVPYTQLLEAERALNDLSFEHNDMLLAIQEQIIELESLTGVAIHVEKENEIEVQ
jgi:cobalt-zinc-cadmium efflux system outer membrane protein